MKASPSRRGLLHTTALAGALAVSLVASGAHAQERTYNIPAQSLAESLRDYGMASGEQIIFAERIVATRQAPALQGDYTADDALRILLADSGLVARRTATGGIMIASASDPQSGSAAGDGADGTVAALIVTAQKKEEAIQDVPIAISAFTEKSLEEQHIEGGFDLLKAIPNVTFSKNNFTSYNFSIRGVGTKAISATTDPGVSVSFNNTGLIVNRLFEQEYFDIERVEVLRGPQGTLYGRNATAGVINVISAKPNLHEFDGWVKGEVGNYHTKRLSAMVNVPLVEDKLAIRLAGALTDRQGYDYNSITKHNINGRDLWSGRLTIGFNPTDRIRSNLIWERFNEDDDRSRTGKQLCHRDEGPLMVGSASTAPIPDRPTSVLRRALFSQGCAPGSLYDDAAFGTVNGLSLPFILWPLVFGGDCGPGCSVAGPLGRLNGRSQTFIQPADPYGGRMQSRNLREVASIRDPIYRAQADIFELNAELDLSDALTLVSQTAYSRDSVYSIQDYNRYNTDPVFTDTLTLTYGVQGGNYRNVIPGGIFCDPQLGCSNRLAGMDQSSGHSKQWSQELRLQSDFDGPVNFSFGANYTRFETQIDYYVFYNILTMLNMFRPFNKANPDGSGTVDITRCPYSGFRGGLLGGIVGDGPVAIDDPHSSCPYIDPNPVESINGQGHNYFRSSNPYKLESWAGFGEVYWNVQDNLKVTAGLRYTNDRKTFTPVPSQLLLAYGFTVAGTTSIGYPEKPDIKQHWGEWTGRLGIDWKPDLSFTDQTLLYAFYSHGYKGGGANPPSPGFATYDEMVAQGSTGSAADQGFLDLQIALGNLPPIQLTAVEYGSTFRPEFVDAFEIGSKNTLFQGAMTLNATSFYYDYKDYQVSQIRDRTAVNENFNAKVWGLELETLFTPSKNLRINANLGYMNTRIADGQTSIDTMNRTQGNPNYVIAKPWVQLPSNCVVPVSVAQNFLLRGPGIGNYWYMCGGFLNNGGNDVIDPATGDPYNVNDYPELNGGAGLRADLGGNDLPNAPHWTMNVGVQYGFDLLEDWRLTVRGDAYWQSQSWARVYNLDPYDKLHGWYNANLSVWFERPADDLKIELYVKNLLDDTPITDSFLNSDDSGLTTNVFTLDPRLIGLSIKKGF